MVARTFKDCSKLALVSPHGVLLPIDQKGAPLTRVLFNENEAAFFLFFVPGQALLPRIDQEVCDVFVSEVAEDPLDPDGVVLLTELVLLETFQVVVARLRTVRASFVELDFGWLHEVDISKDRLQDSLGDAPNASSAIERAIHRRQQVLERVNHRTACVTLRLVDALEASKHTIDSGWLLVPVVDAALVPSLFVSGPREISLLLLFLGSGYGTTIGLDVDRVELTLPHIVQG